VRGILRSPVYAGNLAGYKRIAANMKSKKIPSKLTEEWEVILNTHEGIVTQEDLKISLQVLSNVRTAAMRCGRRVRTEGNAPTSSTAYMAGMATSCVPHTLLKLYYKFIGFVGELHITPTKRWTALKPKNCTVCGVEYVPRSSISKYCPECRERKGIVYAKELPTVKEEFNSELRHGDRISLWKGDITRISADASITPFTRRPGSDFGKSASGL